MRFWRKEPPQGGDVSPEYAAGMRAAEEWYHEFVVWAYSYIGLLEKRVQQLQERDKQHDCCMGLPGRVEVTVREIDRGKAMCNPLGCGQEYVSETENIQG